MSRLRKKKRHLRAPQTPRSRWRFFEQLEARVLLSTVSWVNASGGSWSTKENWSGGVVPGQNDDVVIDLPGAITITHSTGIDTIRSLTSQELVTLSGGTLHVTAVQGAGTVMLAGGTLEGATVQQGTLIKATSSGGTLSGVTLKGDPSQTQPVVLDVSGYPAGVAAVGGLKIDKSPINLLGGTHLHFSSAAAAVGRNGTILV